MTEPNSDNIYPVGMHIYSKSNPNRALTIQKYYQRIYYCTEADDPTSNSVAFFERELLPPTLPILKDTKE